VGVALLVGAGLVVLVHGIYRARFSPRQNEAAEGSADGPTIPGGSSAWGRRADLTERDAWITVSASRILARNRERPSLGAERSFDRDQVRIVEHHRHLFLRRDYAHLYGFEGTCLVSFWAHRSFDLPRMLADSGWPLHELGRGGSGTIPRRLPPLPPPPFPPPPVT
jgi:hypothetical protein